MNKAYLVLEDGTIFCGKNFGASGETEGEVVFNTSMTGYQEILTDPSYYGQMVVMTYPMIGNYGVNNVDIESSKPYVSAFIVKEYSKVYSNYRASSSLGDYLKKHNTIGIEGIDTRKLVKHIREKGSMNAIISNQTSDLDLLKDKACTLTPIVGKDLVKEVTTKKKYIWEEGTWVLGKGFYKPEKILCHVVAVDFGIKRNILRHLVDNNCKVTVVPAFSSINDIAKLKPDAVFLSNGPGDPEPIKYGIELTKSLIGKYPIFGICLGNQILSIALGAKTYKLKFGHHGGNHPVKDLSTGKVEITTQNHCFGVDLTTLKDNVELTHINLNDGTVEGVKHKTEPIFSVQYHPENGPGPHDSAYLFKRFIEYINI